MEPLLRTDNLKKNYSFRRIFSVPEAAAKIPAVDGVSLEIYPGQMVGLVGASGCGKTTLAKLILRLLPPDSGQIFYAGENVAKLRGKNLKNWRRRCQIVFQNPYNSLNPRQKAKDILAEPLIVHRLAARKELKDKAVELLELVGLTSDDLNHWPHQFSAGGRQRIAIARALAGRPEFLVLDEPVSSLDVSIQAQILNLIKDLQKKFNLTGLFITHDLAVAYQMCGRIVVMDQGKIVEDGPAEEIIRNPKESATRQLLAALI